MINFNIMQNSSNEEFTKTYKRIKEIQTLIFRNINSNLICMIEKREMAKSNKEIKEYYLIYIIIESNKSYITFESLFGKNNMVNQNLTVPTNTKIGEFLGGVSKTNKKIFLKKFEINKNKNEILIKIRQTQILSIKQLTSNYNLKLNDVLDLTIKEIHEFNQYNNIVDKETNRLISNNSVNSNTSFKQTNSNNNIFESIDYFDKFFKLRTIEEHFSFINKKNNSFFLIYIYLLIVIWIFITLSFIFFQSISLFFSYQQLEKEGILSDILINSLITRNIIYSFITSLLSMQYIVNGLHNNIIDNGFTNTIPYHKEKIYDRVKDFLYFFKIFERQEKYLCDYNEIEVINIFFEELDYISVKTENLTVKHSLNSILSRSHLRAYQVIENNVEPFLFNISYYTIENRELLGESAFFQFVFDNYFCNGKYTWDEIDNLIYHHIETKTSKKLNIIYLISIFNGILVCGILIIQSFFYFKLNDQIYAKYYINYNYLQFFNNLLLKKVNLIKDFINNTDIENLYKFNNEKITYENMIEDNNLFKQNYIRINNKIPIIIKSYKINEFLPNESIKLTLNKSNSIYVEKSNTNLIHKGTNKNALDNPYSYTEMNNNILEKKKLNNSPNKSPRKKKRKEKRGSNIITLNNTTNNNLINESNDKNPLNILQELNQIQSKKDLAKPKHIIAYLIFFFVSIIILTIFFILNDLIIKKMLNKRILFTNVIKNIIETVTNTQEILNIYGITILKGDIITFNYKSHGYLNSFKELDYINDITEHNIMEEVISKSEISLTKFLNLIEENSDLFQSFSIYLHLINSPGACEYYTNYYIENKKSYDYSFLNAFNYEIDELIEECKNISYGVNLNGITSAGSNLQSYVITLYYEFKGDNKRAENLLTRVNNEKFIGLWTQIDLIYDKVVINLIINWKKDLKKIENKYQTLNYFIFTLIIFFICCLFVAYIIFFPIKILNENEIITQVEPCLYNTIMF